MEQKDSSQPTSRPAQLGANSEVEQVTPNIDPHTTTEPLPEGAVPANPPPATPKNTEPKPANLAKRDQPRATGEETKKESIKNKLNSIDLSFRVSLEEKVFLAKNLSVILKSGISLPESLKIVSEQSHGKLKKVLADVYSKVESGKALNVALSDHKDVFDQFFINMIKIGEKSGTLDQSLGYLSDQLTKDSKLISKVKSASLYPTIVMITAVGVGGGVSYFILPKLTKLFASFKAGLPFATKVLLQISSIIEKYGLFLLLAIAALIVIFWLLLKIKSVKTIWHKIILITPVASKLTKSLNLARISLTLGTLMKNSVDIVESLAIASAAISFIPYQKALVVIQEEVKKGKTIEEGINLADPKEKLFDPTVKAMIKVGEKTGSLYNSLLYISDYYEEEVDNITKDMATILEPILLIIIAIVVAFVAIAIISPMYQILNYINK